MVVESGFEDYIPTPSHAHWSASASALRDLCKELSEVTKAGADDSIVLRIRLCHFKQNHWLTPRLFCFNLAKLGGDGVSLEDAISGNEITFALVLNHSVDAQIRSAISTIASLIMRQAHIAKIRVGLSSIDTIDSDVKSLDGQANDEIADRLRFGYRSATSALARSASERGFRLECRYEPDLLPTKDLVDSRIPTLRALYNQREDVRSAVDGTVAMIGSGRIASVGGSESMRDLVQRSMTLWNFSKHMNHTFRDALVCGNGFMVVNAAASAPLSNLDPLTTTVLAEGVVEVGEGNTAKRRIDTGVVHIRGIEQIDSLLGVSPLEVLLPHVQTLRVIDETVSELEQFDTSNLSKANRAVLSSRKEMRARAVRATTEAIRELFADFVPTHGPAFADLYFQGYELM